MAIVIGSVVGLVFLILCVILGIHVERTVRKNRKKAETPDGSESERVLSKDGMRHPVDRRLWQGRSDSMQEPTGTRGTRETRETPLQEAIDGQRMHAISRVMGRLSNSVSEYESSCNQYVTYLLTYLFTYLLILFVPSGT